MRFDFPTPKEPGPIASYDVTPETPAEAVELNKVLRLIDPETDPLQFADFIQNQATQTVDIGPRSKRDGCGFVLVRVATHHADPYVQLLQRRTGHCLEDHEDVIDLVQALGQIGHTRQLVEAFYRPGSIEVCAIVAAYGKFDQDDDAERTKKAAQWLRHGLEDDLGRTHLEPEFIGVGNGSLFKVNPEYHRHIHRTAYKEVGNRDVWRALWFHWVENYANKAQRALLDKYASYRNGPTWPQLTEYQGFHVDNYKTHVTWDDFSQLEATG